jgi:tetratricopeptide (TPR) repeat protein
MKHGTIWLVGAALGLLVVPGGARAAEVATGPRTTADVLSARGEYSAAIVEYRLALAEAPKDATLHNRLAVCYQRADQLGQARKEYENALKLNPEYVEARNNLGTLYHVQRKYAKAAEEYAKALKLRPGFPTGHKNLGAAYLALGKVDEAIAAFQEALKLDPEIFDSTAGGAVSVAGVNPGLHYYLVAKVYARSGQLDNAMAYLLKAQENGYRGFAKAASDPDFKGLAQQPSFVALTH